MRPRGGGRRKRAAAGLTGPPGGAGPLRLGGLAPLAGPPAPLVIPAITKGAEHLKRHASAHTVGGLLILEAYQGPPAEVTRPRLEAGARENARKGLEAIEARVPASSCTPLEGDLPRPIAGRPGGPDPLGAEGGASAVWRAPLGLRPPGDGPLNAKASVRRPEEIPAGSLPPFPLRQRPPLRGPAQSRPKAVPIPIPGGSDPHLPRQRAEGAKDDPPGASVLPQRTLKRPSQDAGLHAPPLPAPSPPSKRARRNPGAGPRPSHRQENGPPAAASARCSRVGP